MRFVVVCASFLIACAAGVGEAAAITPDPAIQPRIDEIGLLLAHAKTPAEMDASLAALNQFENGQTDKVVLVEQIAYYLRHGATTEDRGYGAIILFSKLNVSQHAIAQAALACLDDPDVGIKKIAADFLSRVEPSTWRDVSFSVFDRFLRGGPEDLPSALIPYMYMTDADSALVALAPVFLGRVQAKNYLEQIEGASEEQTIARIAGSSEWWAYLYITQKMEENPSMRDSALIEELCRSEHVVVRDAALKLGQ